MLRQAELDIEGRMPWSSNGTWLVNLVGSDDGAGTERRAIYKPHAHERPLWDFPDGLYLREVASYELSRHLGWELVPPTVLRDGPHGIGSVQLFIEADFEQHYFTLMEAGRNLEDFRALCAFDIVSNNTDRKSGHCLIGPDGRIHAIDNGLSFHAEFKLRTVIWDFAAELIPAHLVADLIDLIDEGLPDEVTDLIDTFEHDAVLARARALIQNGVFPTDPSGRRYPWPLV
ncbi:MAG: SCO1664 family protein [Actinomycetia bacterium]|nr:SCO1664 family protein [Actinomycetes bacterium]